jgi:hypothetical protein
MLRLFLKSSSLPSWLPEGSIPLTRSKLSSSILLAKHFLRRVENWLLVLRIKALAKNFPEKLSRKKYYFLIRHSNLQFIAQVFNSSPRLFLNSSPRLFLNLSPRRMTGSN